MKLLITLLGLILILEGLPYVTHPQAMQEWLRRLGGMPPQILRVFAALAMGMGFVLCYLTQRTTLLG